MRIGRVCGTVVTTVQQGFYEGKKQLIVRYIDPTTGAFEGEDYVVATDLVGAGVGETVIIEDEGNSARQLMNLGPTGPVRSVILGIVDKVSAGS